MKFFDSFATLSDDVRQWISVFKTDEGKFVAKVESELRSDTVGVDDLRAAATALRKNAESHEAAADLIEAQTAQVVAEVENKPAAVAATPVTPENANGNN